jgi:hypothetical protein
MDSEAEQLKEQLARSFNESDLDDLFESLEDSNPQSDPEVEPDPNDNYIDGNPDFDEGEGSEVEEATEPSEKKN